MGRSRRSRRSRRRDRRAPRARRRGRESRARAGERGRSRARPRTAAFVSRRERQAVRIADGRHRADLDLEIEIADEPPDHGDLLRVLLPEVGALRADDVEELQANRRDAAEVAGAVVALEPARDPLHVDPGLEAGRVDLLRRGREEDVGARVRRRARRRGLSSRGYAARSEPSSNCAGLTKRLTTTTSFSARAARINASWPACNAPIVGTRPIEPGREASSRRSSSMLRAVLTAAPSSSRPG